MQKHEFVPTKNTTIAMQDAASTNPELIFPGDNPKHFTHPRANGYAYIDGVRVDYEFRRDKTPAGQIYFRAFPDGLTVTARVDVDTAIIKKLLQDRTDILDELRRTRIYLKRLIETSKHPDYCEAFKHKDANAYVDIVGVRVEYKLYPSNVRKVAVILEPDGLAVNAPSRMSIAEINANLQFEISLIFTHLDIAVDRIKANAKWETVLRDLPNAPRFTHPHANEHAQIGDSLVDYQLLRANRKSKGEIFVDQNGLTVVVPFLMRRAEIQEFLGRNQELILAGLKESALLKNE
jgi:predicted metal-dependent hydrolase